MPASAPARAREAAAPAAPAPPRALPFAWGILAVLVAAEAIHEVFGVGGPDTLYADWIHDSVLVVCAMLCLGRAIYEPPGRAAWLTFGAGLACWALGDTLWSIQYGGDPDPPYPTISDALWLAWYPITAVGLALLIRVRVARFELHRWMDGLAVMLVVLTPAAAVVLQPLAEHSSDSTLAEMVDFSYPVLDVLLMGAILGVCGLLAWHPGRVWLTLGLGCLIMTVGDAVFAVQQARGSLLDGDYDFVWTAGAALIAYAAWLSAEPPHEHVDLVGWRAIALPLAAQVLAAAIQVYGLFHELGSSERVVTLVVLAIASVQIVLSRPRGTDAGRPRDPARTPD